MIGEQTKVLWKNVLHILVTAALQPTCQHGCVVTWCQGGTPNVTGAASLYMPHSFRSCCSLLQLPSIYQLKSSKAGDLQIKTLAWKACKSETVPSASARSPQPDCRDPTAVVAPSAQRFCLDLYCRMGLFPEPCAGLVSDRQGHSQQDSFLLSSHSNHPNRQGKNRGLAGKKGGKQQGLPEEKLGSRRALCPDWLWYGLGSTTHQYLDKPGQWSAPSESWAAMSCHHIPRE